MARTLNSKYFELLSRRVEGDYEYQAYAAKQASSTMDATTMDKFK